MSKTAETKAQSKTQSKSHKPAGTKIQLKELPVKKEVKGGVVNLLF